MNENKTTAHRRKIDELKWFHSIDFGNGLISPGRFPPTMPPNYTLFGIYDALRFIDLKELSCLDIGTVDGIIAFILKKLGAAQVTATDMALRENFTFGRELLQLDVNYKTPVSLEEMPSVFKGVHFDLVVMAGVLYHVFDPLRALSICRDLLRESGYLLVETSYLFDEKNPCMSFNPMDRSSRCINLPNVFWRPSKSCVEGMLQVTGFQVVASFSIGGRITFLAQAKKPSQITTSTPLIETIHQRYMNYPNYGERIDYDELQNTRDAPSTVTYAGPRTDRIINRATYTPRVPLQPQWQLSSDWYGLREWLNCTSIGLRTRLARK